MSRRLTLRPPAGAIALAAAIALALIPAIPESSPATSIAQDAGTDEQTVWILADGQKRANFVVTYDPLRARLVAVPLDVAPEPGRDLWLWLVLATGPSGPIPLGVLHPSRLTIIGLEAAPARFARAILVVSAEPRGREPNAGPAGPVIFEGGPSPVRKSP